LGAKEKAPNPALTENGAKSARGVNRYADRQSHYRLPCGKGQVENEPHAFREANPNHQFPGGRQFHPGDLAHGGRRAQDRHARPTAGWRSLRAAAKRAHPAHQGQGVQVDEIWTYVFKKQAHLDTGDNEAVMGDQYVFVAIDADTKLVISHLVGKRDGTTAFYLIQDLQSRLVSRVQLTTDGFRPYLEAVEGNFGADVDYAMLVKVYAREKGGDEGEGPAWYGPAKVTAAIPTPIMGDPDWAHISTSYIERQNLTMRMQMRRFTRLTNAFSKKLSNLKAQVALHFAHYNFVRIHQTLRVTPMMEAGLTDHVWTIQELLANP
jgi:IS1 family transposase